MQRVLVVVRAELGHVGRVEIEHVRAETPDGLGSVEMKRLAGLTVVKHQTIELARGAAEGLDELPQRRVGELRLPKGTAMGRNVKKEGGR